MSDSTKFSQQVMPYHRKMFAVAYRFLQREDEAEDAVQDVLVKLWQMREKLPPDETLEAYILTMTRNLCIDRIRSRHEVCDDEDGQWKEECIDEDLLENKDRLRLVLSFIRQLPGDQQKVLRLKVFEDLPNEQIGALLNLKQDNVRQLLSRARKRLRELAQKQGVI
jgi:RNA polymerase sigma-70 factor, ECF subfamily